MIVILVIITIFNCGGFLLKRIQTRVCLFFFCVFAASGIAQEIETTIQTLTLPQAVEQALANYPALQIQQYSIEQAQGL